MLEIEREFRVTMLMLRVQQHLSSLFLTFCPRDWFWKVNNGDGETHSFSIVVVSDLKVFFLVLKEGSKLFMGVCGSEGQDELAYDCWPREWEGVCVWGRVTRNLMKKSHNIYEKVGQISPRQFSWEKRKIAQKIANILGNFGQINSHCGL